MWGGEVPKQFFFSGLAVEVGGCLGCGMDSNDLLALALWVSCRVFAVRLLVALLASAGVPGDLLSHFPVGWGRRCRRAPALSP